MELKVTTLEGKEAGSVQLSDEIFGLEPRKDIIQRVINWQLMREPMNWVIVALMLAIAAFGLHLIMADAGGSSTMLTGSSGE